MAASDASLRPLEILTVDGPRAGVLRRRAQPVRSVTRDVQVLIDQMFLTMRTANGLGLAAPQVGVSQRVLVSAFEGRQLALVNPVVLRHEGEAVATEACLSIPGLLGMSPGPRMSLFAAGTGATNLSPSRPTACWHGFCSTRSTTWRAFCLPSACETRRLCGGWTRRPKWLRAGQHREDRISRHSGICAAVA